MRGLVLAMFLMLAFAGCVSEQQDSEDPLEADVDTDGDGMSDADELAIGDDPFTPFMPRVVVAVVDTGIMPYHDEFRLTRAGEDPSAHPSTYLEGFPATTRSLNISLDLADPEEPGERELRAGQYREADEALWESTKRDTLYHLPGTKFVGVIGIGANLPGGGHGSMTSSRAGGNTISVGGDEVLLVHVRVPLAFELDADGETNEGRATRWAADQPWIDIQSHSWGNFVACSDVAANHAWGWAEAFKYARDKQPVFVAAANGHANAGALGYPSQCQSNNPAGVITVGGTDNGGYARWANWWPAISADGCANPAVSESDISKIQNTGGGTSSATPFAAGVAAKVVLEARRTFRDPGVGVHDGVMASLHPGGTAPETGPLADGDLTIDELKDVLFHTALSPPTIDPSDGDACQSRVPIPEGTSGAQLFPFIGYGEVNNKSGHHAIQVLMGEADMPARPEEDDLYARDQQARRQMWG